MILPADVGTSGAGAAPASAFADVHRVVCAAHCQQGADDIEAERIYARPAAELVQLLRARDASRTDDDALLRDRREKHASTVQCMHGDGRLLRTDDLGDN